MPRPPDGAALARLRAIVGDGGWLDAPADIEGYARDFRGLYYGKTPLVLLPRSAEQVAQILRLCHAEEIAVVPQGGNTSYCGAATPDDSGTQIVLAMRRLNRIRAIDAANDSLTVEAGCTLAEVQEAAAAAGRLFPLSLGSEGSAQIGGNLATNAGGTAVLRYGMMRDLVLGLEVVLADGRVLASLKGLRKDNTGYDVKSLFIGAEGTLGVITAACLKLFPAPAAIATALVGLSSPEQALALLASLRAGAADQLSTFEIMPRRAVEITVAHVPGVANPLDGPTLDGPAPGGPGPAGPAPGADARGTAAPWYALVELTSPNAAVDLVGILSEHLSNAGALADARLATSGAQAAAMWKLRESVPEAQRHRGASLKHDISVPVSALPRLLAEGTELVRRLAPEGETIAYGHVGDGNLHFNVSQRPGSDPKALLARKDALEEAMFDLVGRLGGSFSAEHGIGRLRAAQLARRTDPVELALMRDLKRALDPKGILNPGKVLL
jgi:FAD/FMN-containing dehydrogenase